MTERKRMPVSSRNHPEFKDPAAAAERKVLAACLLVLTLGIAVTGLRTIFPAVNETISPETSECFFQPEPKNPAARIAVNSANAEELCSIPGIGSVIAERIIEVRGQCPFQQPDDLLEVKGIGPKKLEKMKEFISIP